MSISTLRARIHARCCDADLDWLYNRSAVEPGANWADAPASLREARKIANEARENGTNDRVVDEWLVRVENIIRDARLG